MHNPELDTLNNDKLWVPHWRSRGQNCGTGKHIRVSGRLFYCAGSIHFLKDYFSDDFVCNINILLVLYIPKVSAKTWSNKSLTFWSENYLLERLSGRIFEWWITSRERQTDWCHFPFMTDVSEVKEIVCINSSRLIYIAVGGMKGFNYWNKLYLKYEITKIFSHIEFWKTNSQNQYSSVVFYILLPWIIVHVLTTKHFQM